MDRGGRTMNEDPDALQQLIDTAGPALAESPEHGDASFLSDHARWWTEQRRRLRNVRRLVLGGGVAYVAFCVWLAVMVMHALERGGGDTPQRLQLIWVEMSAVAAIPVVLIGLALWLAHRHGAVSQLMARALLWSLTVIVGLMQWRLSALSRRGADPEFPIGDSVALVGTIVCVGALLLLGSHGLKSPRATGFRRTPLHGLLNLSLVMGLADAILLLVAQLVMGGLSAVDPVVMLLCAWLGVSAWGLYRLRTWGLIAMIFGNVAELALASQGIHAFTIQMSMMPIQFSSENDAGSTNNGACVPSRGGISNGQRVPRDPHRGNAPSGT
ncbi:MAG: hypothetical protein AAF721_15715, partial [Myxococcota bacterium]